MNHDIAYFEDNHEYIVDGVSVPSVTTILHPITSGGYSKVAQAVLERAAMRGTMVHEATEMIDYNAIPEEVDGEIIGYINAYIDFKRTYLPEWELVEKIVYDTAEGRYIGTLDRYGKIAGVPTVLDIKTNTSPTKENLISLCCQTAAYAKALCSPSNTKRYGLYLKSDGTYRVVDCIEYEKKYGFDGLKLFEKCLDLYEELKGIKDNNGRK